MVVVVAIAAEERGGDEDVMLLVVSFCSSSSSSSSLLSFVCVFLRAHRVIPFFTMRKSFPKLHFYHKPARRCHQNNHIIIKRERTERENQIDR